MPPRPDVSAERRAQIIEAALTCFSRKGYNNTTMDDIVTESGLSKGSLYWYFESKDELFAEVLLSIFMNVGQEAFAALEQCTTAADRLRALAQATADISRQIEGVFALFLEFWGSSSHREEASQLWLGALVEFKDLLAGIIKEGINSGEFKPVDADELVWAIMAAYDGLAAYDMMVGGLDLDRISNVFAETILSGLMADEQADN